MSDVRLSGGGCVIGVTMQNSSKTSPFLPSPFSKVPLQARLPRPSSSFVSFFKDNENVGIKTKESLTSITRRCCMIYNVTSNSVEKLEVTLFDV